VLRRGLPMSAGAVALLAGLPRNMGAGFDFRRVFLAVAPVAQALKVLRRVIEVVAVAVVDLASARLAATFAGSIWLQASCAFSRRAPRGAVDGRAEVERGPLARRAAIRQCFEAMSLTAARLGVWGILALRPKLSATDWAGLQGVGSIHFVPILL
jgi:hypothetical protein